MREKDVDDGRGKCGGRVYGVVNFGVILMRERNGVNY